MMKSAPPPLPRRLFGVCSWIPLLLLCGTFLLPPVSGQDSKKGLKCRDKSGAEEQCSEYYPSCCERLYPIGSSRVGCRTGGCSTRCIPLEAGSMLCTCFEDNCNDVDNNPWKDLTAYKNYHARYSSTKPNGSNAVVVSGLVLVVAAFSSLPHLI